MNASEGLTLFKLAVRFKESCIPRDWKLFFFLMAANLSLTILQQQQTLRSSSKFT